MSDDRGCTCHPDDSPPRPCKKKFALTECRLSAAQARIAELEGALGEIAAPSTVAGTHEQDRDKKLQSIARAALAKGEP